MQTVETLELESAILYLQTSSHPAGDIHWEFHPEGLYGYDTKRNFAYRLHTLPTDSSHWNLRLWDLGYDGNERRNTHETDFDLFRLTAAVTAAEYPEGNVSTELTVPSYMIRDYLYYAILLRDAQSVQAEYVHPQLLARIPGLTISSAYENATLHKYTAEGTLYQYSYWFYYSEGIALLSLMDKPGQVKWVSKMKYGDPTSAALTDHQFTSLFCLLAATLTQPPYNQMRHVEGSLLARISTWINKKRPVSPNFTIHFGETE